MELINTVFGPLEWIVSFVLVAFHSGLTALGLPADGGASWTLSIVGLVILIRIILIPLFVRQIKAQRGLQILQPKMKEIQKKYKDDREKQSAEMMKLYKETGTNPLASCLPILAQSPIFFALFQVLNGIATGQGDTAPAFGTHQSDMQGVAMPPMHFAGMVVHNAGAQSQLNVGVIGVAFGRHKALRLRHIGRDPACAFVSPLQHGLDHVPSAFQRKAHGVVDFVRFVNQHRGDMVL